MAELWGIYEGLKLANRRGVMRIELGINSQVIAHSLQDMKNCSTLGCALMKRIRQLLDRPWEVQIIHVFRDANRCVDMLANMGNESINGMEFFENPPSRVVQILKDDIRGVFFPRLISV
jgi:ribonuclease HI